MSFVRSQKDFTDVHSIVSGLAHDYADSSMLLSTDKPWSAWFAIRHDEKVQEYLVGVKMHSNPLVLSFDHALVKEIYFDTDVQPGQTYDFDIPHRLPLEQCEVLAKASIYKGKEQGKQIQVELPDGVHTFPLENTPLVTPSSDSIRTVSSQKVAPSESFAEVSKDSNQSVDVPEDEAPVGLQEKQKVQENIQEVEQTRDITNIMGLLTPEQIDLITRRSDRPMIIQGKAGSGKTTVALFRLSRLVRPSETSEMEPIAPEKILYVMFNRALCSFVETSLEHLDLGAISQHVFYDWALTEIRKAYKRAPLELFAHGDKLNGYETATRLKKRVEILSVIEEFVEEQSKKVQLFLDKYLPLNDHEGYWGKRFQEEREKGTPIAHSLSLLRTEVLEMRNNASSKRARGYLVETHKVFQRAFQRITTYKRDLRRFLTNTDLLLKHFPSETAKSIAPLVGFQKELQGTTSSPSARIVEDDLSLLLYLIQLKHGGLTDLDKNDALHFYDHLVIDEAQDFGALELKVLFNSMRTRHGATIVGDTNQNILSGKRFKGWHNVAAELGIGDVEIEELTVSHRSTKEIMRIADDLVGAPTHGARSGPIPVWYQEESERDAVDRIEEIIKERHAENPDVHICVVAPTHSKTRKLLPKLQCRLQFYQEGFTIRKGGEEEFIFKPGVSVAYKKHVKGLEFDTVILVEPIDGKWYYPETEEGKNLIYTAITRAENRLFFVSQKPLTPWLDHALEEEWIEAYTWREPIDPDIVEDADEPF